jgi:hypothetical protein
MPVTIPMTKLMRNILPQNFAIRWYSISLVMTYRVSMMARRIESPKVKGTNKKWK